MATKVTFTLDDATIQRLQLAADRLRKPKSEIVRDAISDFHDRIGRLSEAERRRLLSAFDTLVPAIPTRSQAMVEREIAEVRETRQVGGRRAGSRRR